MEFDFQNNLKKLFGFHCDFEYPLSQSGMGISLSGIDLSEELKPDQVSFLLDCLSYYRILKIPNQNLEKFTLYDFENFSKYWGCPLPHPNNFLRGGKPGQSDGDSKGEYKIIPKNLRPYNLVNKVFPGKLKCLEHESPCILVVSNFGKNSDKDKISKIPKISSGGSWHTDIEYEKLPMHISMFLVHKAPCLDEDGGNNWIEYENIDQNNNFPYFEGSSTELMKLRKNLPLNGETAFADTAAAYNDLEQPEKDKLSKMMVRRRLNEQDEGWLAPLVIENPRSGIKSLHSPIWASRPNVRPPIVINGMSTKESRNYLDDLELHVLQKKFRYDNKHKSGDVLIWDNFMTLHNIPPLKVDIDNLRDARLLYRISCKGNPSLKLPRKDSLNWIKENISGWELIYK